MALETSAEKPAPLRQISQLIEGYIGRLGAVWVEAEIAQLTRRQGVCFLTLRDLTAKISIDATCSSLILDASPTPITEGARVIVHAKPTFYSPRGSLSLELREIRPQGEGELLAQLERRKQLLAAEGLFDPRLKKPLPLLPQRHRPDHRQGIGRRARHPRERPTALARRTLRGPPRADAGQQLRRRRHGRAAATCSGRLGRRHRHRPRRRVDRGPAAVLRRGAHPRRARRHQAGVSAIGHEPDIPLLDLVADLRASTPTDAAKRIVPDVREELAGVASMRERANHGHPRHARTRGTRPRGHPLTTSHGQSRRPSSTCSRASSTMRATGLAARSRIASTAPATRSVTTWRAYERCHRWPRSSAATPWRSWPTARSSDRSTRLPPTPSSRVRLADGSVGVRSTDTTTQG